MKKFKLKRNAPRRILPHDDERIQCALTFNTSNILRVAHSYDEKAVMQIRRGHKMRKNLKRTMTVPAARCGRSYRNIGLNQEEKESVLAKHNELRRKVASGNEARGYPGPQPAAVYMPDLTWDNELEIISQRWANQCNFNHDKCRNVERFVVGQNIAQTYYTSNQIVSKPAELISVWYDEVAKLDKSKVSKFQFDSNTGHYTQLVWATTTKIGCGRIIYKNSVGWNVQYLVCNYGPSGNLIGQKIYDIKK